MLYVAKICDRMVEIGILFLIIFTPLYYGSVDPIMVLVIEVTIILMLLFWGIGMALRGEFVLRKTPLDIPILLFCIYSLFSTIFLSRYTYASYNATFLVLCISALYFIAVNHLRSKGQMMRLFMAIILIGCIHAFVHLMRNAAGAYGSRSGAMLNVGNHFAGYMVIMIPLAVAMSFMVRDTGKRILIAFAGIMMAAAMTFSLVAGAMVSFLISLVFIALLFIRSRNTRKPSLIITGIALCFILLIVWFGYEPVLNELLTVADLETGRPAGRLLLWRASLRIFAHNPITGTGLGTFDHIFPKYRLPEVYGKPVYAHSDWLQLLTESGIVGFIIVLSGAALLFSFIFRRLLSSNLIDGWREGLIVGGLSSISAGLFHALVDFNLHIPAILILYTIVIAMTSSAAMYGRRAGSSVRDWKVQISVPVRITGAALLILVVGLMTSLVIRPCIADAYRQRGAELEVDLYWDEAAEKYRSASELSHQNSDYFYALGNVYAKRVTMNRETDLQERWYRLAVKAYIRAIEMCPLNGDYHLALGNLHETAGNEKRAGYEYLKAISLDPNNAFYHRTYGTFCLKQGDFEASISEYKKALAVYPDDLDTILSESQQIISSQWDDPGRRIRHLASAICPDDFDSRMALARFFRNNAYYEAACSGYQDAILIAPEKIGVRKRLSNILISQGESEKAEAIWKDYLERYPESAEAHSCLAYVYIRQGQLEGATAEYLTAADIERCNPYYRTRAGEIYLRRGMVAEAARAWQDTIDQYPHTAGKAYYHLGKYYEAQGNWLEAAKHLQQAISAEPDNLRYRMHLAQGYYSRELFYEAIQEWERILEIKPDNIDIHLRLARIYSEIDRKGKSQKHYQKVLKIQPENGEAKEALVKAKETGSENEEDSNI